MQALQYAHLSNLTTEALYPFTTGIDGNVGTCNKQLLRSAQPGQVVQLGDKPGFVYPWLDERAIMEVGVGALSLGCVIPAASGVPWWAR